MIGNEYLNKLFSYHDENAALSELYSNLSEDISDNFINVIKNKPVDINNLTESEKDFITKVTCLIEYFYIENNINVPTWVQNDELKLDTPYVFGTKEKDITHLKTIITAPPVFKSRNVFFDLDSMNQI
jgi:hypothetical protein